MTMQIHIFALLLLLVCCNVRLAESFCLGSGIYHLAAEALSVGIGPLDSDAVCVYGNNKDLDEDCPFSCQALLTSAWGDCYCRNPDYKPKSFAANGLLRPLSVYETFKFMAQLLHPEAPHATCRIWLNEHKADWTCYKKS